METFEEDVVEKETEQGQTEQSGEMPQEEKAVQEKERGKSAFFKELMVYILIVLVCLFVIPNYVMQRTVVDGSSMCNTLQDGDNLMVEKVSYHFTSPDRFDIVVFYPYGREDGRYYVKRIIGLPGETIEIIGNDIYINGELLEEQYGKDPMEEAWDKPITLGDDEYFVLGDNRSISLDSREIGPVKRNLIEGRVIFRMYPFDTIGTVD